MRSPATSVASHCLSDFHLSARESERDAQTAIPPHRVHSSLSGECDRCRQHHSAISIVWASAWQRVTELASWETHGEKVTALSMDLSRSLGHIKLEARNVRDLLEPLRLRLSIDLPRTSDLL